MNAARKLRLSEPATAPEVDRWAPPKGGRFAFRHPALRKPGCVFELDASRVPCFKVELGDVRAVFPLRQVPATFEIAENHPDRALLARVPAALNFVSAIAADDPIPNEIVDGSPSWVPREEYLDRAVHKLSRALGLDSAAAAQTTLQAGVSPLARHLAPLGKQPNDADLFDVIGGVARADWLCRRVVAVQGLVGGFARAAGDQATKTAAEAARAGALALRQAAIWAGQQAMRIDEATADPVDALTDPAAFRARAYPLLAALRAFAVDVDGLLAAWRRLRDRPDGALSGEIEALAGTAVARYAKFDPRRFEALAAGRTAKPFAAFPFAPRSVS